jgi:hypothetical protein
VKSINLNKILSLAFFLLFLLLAFLLFAKIWNISRDIMALKPYRVTLLIYITVFIISGLFLYFMLRKLENDLNTLQSEYFNLKKQLEAEKEIIEARHEENQEATINIDEIVSTILPRKEGITQPEKYFEELLLNIAKQIEIVQGIVFINNNNKFSAISTYAYYSNEKPASFSLGETIPGQVAKDKKPLIMSDMPENYIKIISGLGQGSPRNLFILPVVRNETTVCVIELASFQKFTAEIENIFLHLAEKLSVEIE